MADQNRTEPATPRRKQKARDQGQVPRSREISSAVALIAVVLFLRWQVGYQTERWSDLFRRLLAMGFSGDFGDGTVPLMVTATVTARLILPVLGLAWAIALASTVAQGGLVFAPAALMPNLGRFNPATNIQRLFSFSGLSGLLKSLLPASILLYMFGTMLARDWTQLGQLSRFSFPIALSWFLSHAYELLWKSGLVFLGWAGFDWALQRLNFNRSLRMSRQELRDEAKDLEGNPQVRSRIRRIQRQLRRRRMLHDVAKATVVVVNPEHFAVALRYEPGATPAPVVVAKGRNLFAQQIKEAARWHHVPVVENPPLAQALYRAVDVGQQVPSKLYTAVAEILAFIYKAQARSKNAPKPALPLGDSSAKPPGANR